MNKKRFLYFAGIILGSLFFLSGCAKTIFIKNNTDDSIDVNPDDEDNQDSDERYEIYLLAKKSGYNGTYEEWLESIRGDSVELRVSSGYIQWKYKKESNWINLVALTTLAGEKGDPGNPGQSGREIELSTNSTHIVWRYVGDTSWTNLLEISNVSDGKSAYEIAQEVGYTGTKEQWVQSLQGRGILKIEKTKTVGVVDTYTITFTDNTTFEYEVRNGINGSGGSGSSSGSTNPVDPDLIGFSFTEILGMGYSLSGIYNPDETVIVPSEYNGMPVLAIDSFAIQSDNVKNIIIPNSIGIIELGAIYCKNIKNIYYKGTSKEWNAITSRYSIETWGNNNCKIYLLDENGTVVVNGNKYSELSEVTIASSDDIEKYEAIAPNITTINITDDILNETSVDLYYFTSMDEIYYDGTIESWFNIKFKYTTMKANTLYVLDSNGTVTHNGKKYSMVTEVNLPSNFNGYLKYYLSESMDIETINLSNANFINNSDTENIEFIFDNEISIYFDGDYKDITNHYAIYLNLYVLYETGTITHNGKKYELITNIEPEQIDPIDISNAEKVWDPISLSQAMEAYSDVSGSLDTWIVYSKSFGTTYNNVITYGSTTNPIDGITYQAGDILPTWKAFATKLGLTNIRQGADYGATDSQNFTSFKGSKVDSGVYIDKNGNITDLFYNTTSALKELGDDDQLVDLMPYITAGKMPALKKFLNDNPSVYDEIVHNGHIYYTPYLDGFQAVERQYIMDKTQVEKLLDNELPVLTGNLEAGVGGAEKGLNGYPQIEPFIHSTYNYPSDTIVNIVNPSTKKKIAVTVKRTQNIIAQQNVLLAYGHYTGHNLIEQFKQYARAAYGDIIDTYYGGKISKMFTSVGACYNADDLVALLRIFKANPDVLYGSETLYDEVVPVFPRGQANNRVENILNFAATLYGVQGRDSEYDHLFIGADGKIHDFDTQQASYDLLDKLHALYAEGLIQQEFWFGTSATAGLDTFFRKTIEGKSTYGLLEYDYIATQSAANDYYNGIGTRSDNRRTSPSGYNFSNESVQGVGAILSPLTYVSTDSYNWSQSLDDKTGKTLQRYYEANRSVKTTSWAIPAGSDNIDAAIALMDFVFTKEGWAIQNFGPEGYWNYGTVLGETNTPVIKDAVWNHFGNSGLDFWNYCRGFIGSTFGIGHYRPITLDYQACSIYAKESYENIVIACREGVQINSRCISNISQLSWHTTMPMNVFSTIDAYTAQQYAGVTTFWAQANKISTNGTMNGWVAIVAEGSSYSGDVLTDIHGMNYTYSQVKNQIPTKNSIYLAIRGQQIGLIPPEAR